jgi:hypothetical protein
MTTTEHTRQDYMNKKCTHHEYYRQFVNTRIVGIVTHALGDAIRKSKDGEHFGDIPLVRWDALSDEIRNAIDSKKWKRLECPLVSSGRIFWSLSSAVCIAKTAAKMWKESFK